MLNATVCRERLELGLLAAAGLIVDAIAMGRKEVRIKTALLYAAHHFRSNGPSHTS
jgi:THO complex subunit 2